MKLLVVLVMLVLAPSAHADCSTPMWIGTPSGTAIPEHGSLYVRDGGLGFHPDDRSPVVWSDGVPHRWEETRISPDVVRIDYAGGLAASVEVAMAWHDPVTYPIEPRWQPHAAPPRVLQYWHQVSEWTCSNTDSWMIQVDQPTAAFRIRWTHAGHVTEFIEPARTEFDRSVVEVGKRNCMGANIDLDELAAGGTLELTAIRFDGSEVPVVGLPAQLRTDMLTVAGNGLADALGYVHPAAPLREPPRVTNADSGRAFLVVSGGAIALLFFGLLLASRTRTPASIITSRSA